MFKSVYHPAVIFTGVTLPEHEVDVLRAVLLHLFTKLSTTMIETERTGENIVDLVGNSRQRLVVVRLLDMLEGIDYKFDDVADSQYTVFIQINGRRLQDKHLRLVRMGLTIFGREVHNSEQQKVAQRLKNRIIEEGAIA